MPVELSDMWNDQFKPQSIQDFIFKGSWKTKWAEIAVQRIKAVEDFKKALPPATVKGSK